MNEVSMNDWIADIASSALRIEEGDYIRGGLLYCGKCHTPKQCKLVSKHTGARIVPCMCKCKVEEKKAELEREIQQNKLERVKRLRAMGFPDEEMQGWTFENDDFSNKKLSTVSRKYVENFDEMKARGKGLLFYGSVGTGKTFISACIANALIEMGIPCLVTNFARITNQLAGSQDRQNYIDDLAKYDLIVLDDLASERDTEYMGEMVQNIIDARYRSNLPLIVTTNLTAEELKNPADVRRQRIFSRLFEMCIPVEVKGRDRRKVKLATDYKDLELLLGLKEE